jgi:hypothetical protein
MSLECEKNTVNKCIFLVRYETCAFLCRKQNSFSSLASEAMSTFNQQLLRLLVLGLLFSIQPSTEDRSVSDISGLGEEFVPVDNSLPPLLPCTAKKLLYCHLECNKRADCRTFDYDMTTGSIVASPSKPQSSVGTIQLSPSIYVNINNQSCDKCFQSRYETCDTNSSTCQCPLKSYWNGSMCLAQLFLNQTCSQDDMCRSDLNLTCQPSCDFTYRCSDRKSYFILSLRRFLSIP